MSHKQLQGLKRRSVLMQLCDCNDRRHSWSAISWHRASSTLYTCCSLLSSVSCWWSLTRRQISSSTWCLDDDFVASCAICFNSPSASVQRRRPLHEIHRRGERAALEEAGRHMPRPSNSYSTTITVFMLIKESLLWLFDRWFHRDD